MQIVFTIMALLGSVMSAANPVGDLGKGDWWIYKEDWYKYYYLRDGKKLYV